MIAAIAFLIWFPFVLISAIVDACNSGSHGSNYNSKSHTLNSTSWQDKHDSDWGFIDFGNK